MRFTAFWVATVVLLATTLRVPGRAAEFEFPVIESAVSDEAAVPAPAESSLMPLDGIDAAGGLEPADFVGAACNDPACRGFEKCDACAPPYGAVNRLIDNKEACWTLRVDGLLLWRNAPRTQPLYDTLRTGRTALDAHQIDSTPAGGPRFSLFRTNGCGEALEATYFRAANFRGIDRLPNVTDGYAPIYTPQVPFDTVSANLGSSIQSFELNGRTTLCRTIQLLGGFRWVEWNENLSLVGTSTSGVTTYQDRVSIGCINSLYGYQIGFDSLLLTTNWLRVEGIMKGGAYYNNAVASTMATTQDVGPYAYRTGSPHGVAFVGELGITGVVPLHRNIDFRFGYLGLWLESLAQPTNQYARQSFDPAQPAPRLDLTGGTVLQGVTLGLEGRW